MEMVRHRKNELPFPLSPVFAEFDGFDQLLPDFGKGKLIMLALQTVDRDEKRLLTRI